MPIFKESAAKKSQSVTGQSVTLYVTGLFIWSCIITMIIQNSKQVNVTWLSVTCLSNHNKLRCLQSQNKEQVEKKADLFIFLC